MIFTNDGELTQVLAHPKYEHDKEYEVAPNRAPTGDQLGKLRQGVTIGDGDLTSPAKVRVRDGKVYMTIHEGKKRQIRLNVLGRRAEGCELEAHSREQAGAGRFGCWEVEVCKKGRNYLRACLGSNGQAKCPNFVAELAGCDEAHWCAPRRNMQA